MNNQSIDCRKVTWGEADNFKGPGDFCFSEDFSHIYVWLPGCSGQDAIAINRGAPGGPRVWGWDGNENKPTLTPSIHALGQWHGFLTAGRLCSC